MRRRAVITGVGLVTPLGCSVPAVWEQLCEPPTVLNHGASEASDSVANSAMSSPFNAGAYIRDAKAIRLMNRPTRFGVAAAALAAADAHWDPMKSDPARTGICVGALGRNYDYEEFKEGIELSVDGGEFDLAIFADRGARAINPMWVLRGFGNSVLFFVSAAHKAKGVNGNFHMGDVSSTVAIGEAARAIQHDRADVVFAGGYDSLFEREYNEMLTASDLLSQSARQPPMLARPFDRRRDGFVPSEGAGFVLVEEAHAARARGASIYCEVAGYGSWAGPALDRYGPSEAGFASASTTAVTEAGCSHVDAVICHGLATPTSDQCEAAAIRQVLGAAGPRIPVTAPKWIFGNTGAASGAIEAAIACLCLKTSRVPPIGNLEIRDSACNLNFVDGRHSRQVEIETVLLNSANLAGTHAALMLRRFD